MYYTYSTMHSSMNVLFTVCTYVLNECWHVSFLVKHHLSTATQLRL